MSDSADSNVTLWIHQLRDEDHQEAARKLFEYYLDQVVHEARRRFRTTPRRDIDEEDVAQSVFNRFFRKARAGEFSDLADRNELRSFLFRMTRDRVIDKIRKHNSPTRGGGKVRGESVFQAGAGTGDLGLDGIPAASDLDLADDYATYMAALPDDSLREVAQLRAENYSYEDIADALGITPKSVEYKLTLIRRIWSERVEE